MSNTTLSPASKRALDRGVTHRYVSCSWQPIRRFESVVPRSP